MSLLKYKNFFLLVLVILISCKKKDDEVTPADDPLDVQQKRLKLYGI